MRTLSRIVALSLAASTLAACETSERAPEPAATRAGQPAQVIVALDGAPWETVMVPGVDPLPRYTSDDGSVVVLAVSAGWDPTPVVDTLRAEDRVAWAEIDAILAPGASKYCEEAPWTPQILDLASEICLGASCWTSDLVAAIDVAIAQGIRGIRAPLSGRDASTAEDSVTTWATDAGITLMDLVDCDAG